MTAVTTPIPASTESRMDFAKIAKAGAGLGGAVIFISAVGMLEVFNKRLLINPILSMGYLMLLAIPLAGGYLMGRRKTFEGVEEEPRTGSELVGAVMAGAIGGLIAGLFALLVDSVPGIRDTFPKLGPVMVKTLTVNLGVGGGTALLVAGGAVLTLLGMALHWLSDRWRRAVIIGIETVVILAIFEAVIDDFFDWFATLPDFLYHPRGGLEVSSTIVVLVVSIGLALLPSGTVPSLRKALRHEDNRIRRRNSLIVGLAVLVLIVVLPQLLGGTLNELITNVGLFLLMGLGLNIVVGHAGLLDLGYVAFFAVGAYTTAVLTSPLSPFWAPELSWWTAFPIVLVVAAIAGIMVGTPVIRMRGDYLAIVTLGFGEIVRIVLLSDWLSPYFGGAQGIRRIPGIPVGSEEIGGTSIGLFVYFVIGLVIVAAYISWRLENSRIGRAWQAMREDEDVAEAVGIDTVKAKLLAFVTGAVLASFSGALFSAKVGTVFTNSFEIIVSIVILVLVIVGGMGNIAGVAVGAVVLIGVLGGPNQPGLLQEFGEFKLLIYGALLIYMMLQKPEGLVPSVRRAQELHQSEFLQDAWFDKGGEFADDEEES